MKKRKGQNTLLRLGSRFRLFPHTHIIIVKVKGLEVIYVLFIYNVLLLISHGLILGRVYKVPRVSTRDTV